MALFRKKQKEIRAATLGSLLQLSDRQGMTVAGVTVDPETALRSSAVWAAIELIAGVGSSLPLDEFRKQAGDMVQLPLAPIFADPDPDPSVTAVGLRAQLLRSAASRGNAYAELLGAEMGTPSGMRAIHPDRVEWKWQRTVEGGFEWTLHVDGKRRDRWPSGDIWHFALFQQPGSPIGMSPIEYHRQTIGQQLAAQRFGQQFFDGGGNPSLIIKPPVKLSDDEARQLKQKVTDVTRGTREPLVMPKEIDIERMSVNADDSQFLDTQRYGVEEIARVFLGGFAEMIGGSVSGGSVTYANREQRMADFIALSLAPRYLVPLEEALSALVPRGRFVKHNVNALLRADLQARYASYKTSAEVSTLMGSPLLTVNEMRRLENLPPIDGGDTMLAPPTSQARNLEPVVELRDAAQPVSPVTLHVHQAPPGDVTVNVPAPVTEARSEPSTVIVNVPEQPPPIVNVENVVNVPEPATPVVNVETAPPVVNVAGADVVVNLPEQPAPVVNVNVPEEQLTRKRVSYDRQGRVVEIVEEQI